MKAKIGILQDLTPPIQTGRHILMILKTELAVTTITTLPQETILTNSVEPKWATTDFFRTLASFQAKGWWLSKIYMILNKIKNRSQSLKINKIRLLLNLSRRETSRTHISRHRNQKTFLQNLPKRLRQMSRRMSPNLMDKLPKSNRRWVLNHLMNCRRKSKKKRKRSRPSNIRTKKINRKNPKRRTPSSTTWALSLLSTRPNLIGIMWNPYSRATVSKPRLAALWLKKDRILMRSELLPKVTPFSHMRTSWKCGKLTLLCNKKRDSRKNTSKPSTPNSKTKTAASICMIPTGSYKSSCRKAKVNKLLILTMPALLLRNNH